MTHTEFSQIRPDGALSRDHREGSDLAGRYPACWARPSQLEQIRRQALWMVRVGQSCLSASVQTVIDADIWSVSGYRFFATMARHDAITPVKVRRTHSAWEYST